MTKKFVPCGMTRARSGGSLYLTLLARRWESALLVNVDNETLRRLIGNEKAMEIIGKIEGFRNLNNRSDIEILVNETEAIKTAKREGINGEEKKTKAELTAKAISRGGTWVKSVLFGKKRRRMELAFSKLPFSQEE